jgi:DNA mismatch repair ATPase MutS
LYARDLDIFGEGSLFQLLSNARTGMGEEVLAAWLTAPAAPDVIGERQRAVVELAPRLELREDLAALGEELLTGIHGEELMAWGEAEPVLRPSPFRTVAWGLSVLGGLAGWALVAYLVSAAGFYDLSPLVMVWLQVYFWITAAAIGAVLWRFRKRTARVIGDLEDSAKDLGLLAEVVRRLEAEQFESPRLARLRAALDVEGQPPSRRIARLNLLTDLADSRHNQLMGIIGPLLLWDVHLAYAIEEWRRVSGPALRRWLTAVAEMEALSSIAGYHYEHPEYVFPEFTDESPLMEGEALGHPLLGEREAVTNDLRIGGDLRVLIVSGSNMSGKSTMLRTAGVNSVLAQAGAPVRARRLRLSPLTIGASIRTQDSLQEGTSRFYAEITRLQQIMEKAAASPPALFLIDEFLHGTNSHDRRIGAEAIVRGLVDRGAIGLVTTHDLALAHIAENLGPRGANVHFEDHLENGRMHFDYKMRPGVVEKSNAIELMRSVGLDV